jgi:hypothetical protein
MTTDTQNVVDFLNCAYIVVALGSLVAAFLYMYYKQN